MRNIINLFIVAAVAIIFTSCACNCNSVEAAQESMAGSSWQLVQLNSKSVPVEADSYTLTLAEDGRLSGRGACNTIMGEYKLAEKQAITLDKIASTRMLCPDGELEAEYLEMLNSLTHYHLDGEMLMLFCEDEVVAMMRKK